MLKNIFIIINCHLRDSVINARVRFDMVMWMSMYLPWKKLSFAALAICQSNDQLVVIHNFQRFVVESSWEFKGKFA